MTSASNNVDRLSNLPEDLLSHILSLMPTILAVRTSILSKTWRYNWTLIHDLDFDDTHRVHCYDCFLESVNRVFELCKTSQIKIFRLHVSRFLCPYLVVSRWISVAIRLHICELDIQVNKASKLELPSSLFTCKTLTKFRLHFTTPYYGLFEDYASSVNLPNLKTLDIIVFSKPCENALFKVIHGCPILEDLSLEIQWRYDEEDYNFNIPTLKRLKLMIVHTLTTLNINKTVLNVPNLEYLHVKGHLNSLFVMEDLSSLVEAKVSCEVRCDHLWVELLKGISGARSISSTIKQQHWHPPTTPSSLLLPMFSNLKQLELKGYIYARWLLIPKILENSPELEYLCIKESYGACFWNEPRSVPTCMLMNLKTVKYTRNMEDEFDIKFLKYMLANSKVLKMLRVEYDTSLSFEETERLIAKLSMLPRASADCQIDFIGA